MVDSARPNYNLDVSKHDLLHLIFFFDVYCSDEQTPRFRIGIPAPKTRVQVRG